ncbi:hypothetical protein MMYC01_200393 [Madurella mycetomatis]|uniref:Cell cycle control protein n=1 Tax=Madurella mycetomatis TaxID=100816 RepID=A0A175WH43_9PEZI|nr:hypothetical protein MMYC01_200393 [Madurella mycetomatis]
MEYRHPEAEFDDVGDDIDHGREDDSEGFTSPDAYSDSRVSSSPAASEAEEELEDDIDEEGFESDYDDHLGLAFADEFGLEEYEIEGDEHYDEDEDEPGFEFVFEGGDEEEGGDVSEGRRSEVPPDLLFVRQGTGSLPPIGSILDFDNWATPRSPLPLSTRRDLEREEPGGRSWGNQRQHSRHHPYHLPPPQRQGVGMADVVDRDELVAVEVRPARSAGRNSRTPGRAFASAEIIDLTGEPDSPEESRAAAPSRASVLNPSQSGIRNPRRQMSLNQRTPSLSRSDGSLLGNHADVIDLTMDDPPPPPPLPQALPRRDRPRPPAPVDLEVLDGNLFHRFVTRLPHLDFMRFGGLWGARQPAEVDVQIIGRAVDMNNPLAENVPNLNYRAGGHNGGSRKPAHAPPPPPRPGFTRNTGGGTDEVAVCPSCEKELQYDPDGDNANGPPAKKARTRKDREEHHFWAVKECGHVYCKDCFEHRKGGKNSSTNFRKGPENGRKGQILCAVDDCPSDVSKKPQWVGLFL